MTVEIKSGAVIIKNEENPNGFTLPDEYVSLNNKKYENFKTTLGAGEFFVMGDNRLGSLDSRAWGPVKENLIIGRPLLRVLPFSRASVLPGNYSEAH